MQLVQFAIGIAHALQVYYVPDCRYPKAVATFELTEAVYFFVTFFNFYRRTYWKSSTRQPMSTTSGNRPSKQWLQRLSQEA